MNFDITKSKLYSDIMVRLTSFFGLGGDATESDIHNALDGIAPLAEQIESARVSAAAEMVSVNERLAALETQFSDLKIDNEAKAARISELQTQVLEIETARDEQIGGLKKQHDAEIKTLAGQVSSLKAGRMHETDDGGDAHEATRETKSQPGVMKITNSALADLVKKRQSN